LRFHIPRGSFPLSPFRSLPPIASSELEAPNALVGLRTLGFFIFILQLHHPSAANMAPASEPLFKKDEKALCFHHELLYEAKVLDSKPVDPSDKKSAYQYKVHYKGWKNT